MKTLIFVGTFLILSLEDLSELILTGDFNFHVDDPSDSAALKFLDLLDLFNLLLHIDVPIHRWTHLGPNYNKIK